MPTLRPSMRAELPPMPAAARAYIAATALAGLAVLVAGLAHWSCQDPLRYGGYLAVALAASVLKVRLPGITGTMSVNYFFILLGIAQLSLAETLALGCSCTLVQCLWHARMQPKPAQVIFNVASMALAVAASYGTYHVPGLASHERVMVVLLLAAAIGFFLVNTLSIAAVIALTEGKRLKAVWYECFFWSFPYYLVGAALAGLLTAASRLVGWYTALLVLPILYIVYRSYHLYLGRLEDEKKHVEEMARLHLRTIEALALAVDAKDCATHDHLRRVQTYAVEIGKELALSEPELQALRAAALLHDIGKLAVPEYIISKPGRLTPEEFEKMKIHPVVGAEILEKVEFPYPVVPVVRAHHERWDGSGYPDGLKGEQIPIGARILGAVDCLDALASDRRYRRALPLHEAMNEVAAGAGTSFDPRVVKILRRRYTELERLAGEQAAAALRLSTGVRVQAEAAPAAGFEVTRAGGAARREVSGAEFLTFIAAAREEVQMLFELTHELGTSLSLDETLSLLALRLKRMIPYDCIAIYVIRTQRLMPEYVSGENFRLFSSLEIPMGQGLSGWVAENRQPIMNGNPSVEPGYLNDPTKFSTLRAALAVPLEGVNGVVGVLTLYHTEKDAFTKDHLRVLLAVASKVALSVENALKYRQVETSATTDELTGLPNARSLFLHLDGELARAKRSHHRLAVLVGDLDGFKPVNDRFGHLAGNKVLRAVAQAMKETCREYDYVARMGGDEFVLVLPDFGPEGLPPVVARLQRVTAEAARRVCPESGLTLSVGGAFFPADGADAEQLLAEADRRMYRAKQGIKDQLASLAEAVERDWSRALVQ